MWYFITFGALGVTTNVFTEHFLDQSLLDLAEIAYVWCAFGIIC